MTKKFLIFLILLELHIQPLKALPVEESTSLKSGAILLITELSIKNTDMDWVELYYESPDQKPLNLKGLSFADDKIFKKIDENLIMESKKYFILYFKNSKNDQAPFLYTPKNGLTATTEQFIIYDQDQNILDAVCWSNKTPSATEIQDFEKLSAKTGWASAEIKNCLESEKIKNNQSFARHHSVDTNSMTDWYISKNPTPLKKNIPNTEKISKKNIKKPEGIKNKNPASSGKNSKKTKKNQFQNGNLSNNIIISELLPNPKETDSKNEWIELYNGGEKDINLGNWTLDDSEKGSKPYIISDQTIIQAKKTLLIKITDSKLSLGNKEDQVRLYNFKGEKIDEVSYENAPPFQSYALLNIIKKDGEQEKIWNWIKKPTPNEINPDYEKLTGTIISEPQFSLPYSFQIENKEKERKIITFTEEEIAGSLAKITFTPDSEIQLLVQKNKDNSYSMKKYEILKSAEIKRPESELLLPITMGILSIVAISIYLYKKIKTPLEFHK